MFNNYFFFSFFLCVYLSQALGEKGDEPKTSTQRSQKSRLLNPDADRRLRAVESAKRYKKHWRGIVNSGQTCFANAALQCLFATTDLCNSVLLLEDREHPALEAIQEVFARLLFTNRDSINVLKAVKILIPRDFKLGDQQDSAEFLLHAINVLQEAEKDYVEPETTFIDNVFAGLQTTTCFYECCSNSTSKDTLFRSIEVSFDGDLTEDFTVQGQIDQHFTPELIEGTCEKCELKTEIMQLGCFSKLPKNLIVTLNIFRYDFTMGNTKKIAVKLFCNEFLAVKNTTGETMNYRLYGAIIHSGLTATSGHYYSATRDGGRWVVQNDEQTKECTLIDIQRVKRPATPYVLFYKAILTDDDFEDKQKPDFKNLPQRLQTMLNGDYNQANKK